MGEALVNVPDDGFVDGTDTLGADETTDLRVAWPLTTMGDIWKIGGFVGGMIFGEGEGEPTRFCVGEETLAFAPLAT